MAPCVLGCDLRSHLLVLAQYLVIGKHEETDTHVKYVLLLMLSFCVTPELKASQPMSYVLQVPLKSIFFSDCIQPFCLRLRCKYQGLSQGVK